MNNKNFSILKSIGNELRNIRNSKDISLAEIAEKVGVSTMYISEIERSKKVPSDEVIVKLSKIYNVDEKELFEGFGKLTESMLMEIIMNKDLFSLIYDLSNNEEITDKDKSDFYSNIRNIYVKMQ